MENKSKENKNEKEHLKETKSTFFNLDNYGDVISGQVNLHITQ